MRNIKTIFKSLSNFSIPEHERFELIESYADLVTKTDDVLQLLEFMQIEKNAVLRHEISAQLLRINRRLPEVILPIISKIESALLQTANNDESVVSRHEAIEALSSLGGEESFKFLSKLSNTEINKDILDTIRVSLPIIKQRLNEEKNNYSQHSVCYYSESIETSRQ